MTPLEINQLIKGNSIDTNQVSDGYHTFGELYDHRITLWIALCREWERQVDAPSVWRTQTHSDGSVWEGWFLLGADTVDGQITYHLPSVCWDECSFAPTLDKAPDFDGHTPADVLQRIKNV